MNASIRTRLEELRGLRDGWFHGGGAAPGDDFLDWMRDTFAAHYPRDLPPCEILPIVEGGLRVNWFDLDLALAADVYFRPAKSARIYGVSAYEPHRLMVHGVEGLERGWGRAFTVVRRLFFGEG